MFICTIFTRLSINLPPPLPRTLANFERLLVPSTLLQIYYSKMQVDLKLLKRDGSMSWVDKCKRKKDQVCVVTETIFSTGQGTRRKNRWSGEKTASN